MRKSGKAELAISLIMEELRDLGLGQGLERYSVLAQWDRIVGPGMAKRCRPVGFKGPNLVVEVDGGASWQHQVHLMRQQILDKINARIAENKIEGIRVEPPSSYRDTVGGAVDPKNAVPDLDSIPIDEEALKGVLDGSGLDPDDPLRVAMERFLRHNMRLARWLRERPERAKGA